MKKILTESQLAAKQHIIDLQKQLREAVEKCPHVFTELAQAEWDDKWFSESAQCLICNSYFGWRCKISPDQNCHYYTEQDGPNGLRYVTLINGQKHYLPLPSNYDNQWETDDSCLFCGMPDERK